MNSTDQSCNFEAAEKKRVRRRRQSRQVYKQTPLNMAEARREIVSALKLHRASTKQPKEVQQKQSLPLFPQFCPCFKGPEGRIFKSRRNPRIYPACSFDLENGFDFVAPPLVAKTLNLDIPIQTLGLNLNFHDDFDYCKSVDTSSVVGNNSHSFYSLSFLPNSSNICPSVSFAATHQEVPKSISFCEEEGKLMASDLFLSNNNVSTGESEKEIQGAVDVMPLEIEINHSFDKAMEFPDWLSINDDFLQQHSNYHCAGEDYLQDPDLSCLDIGEIEDVDGDWLA